MRFADNFMPAHQINEMKITQEQIRDISADLQMGLLSVINRETYAIRSIPDPHGLFSDLDVGAEELEQIENEWPKLLTITTMKSRQAFQIMEDFIEGIPDENLNVDLIKILNRRSPFANFKMEIESSIYRQKWFDFKNKKYEYYVKEKLRLGKINIE